MIQSMVKQFLAASTCRACGGKVTKLNPAWLRKTREAAGLSQEAMAKRVGVSAPYLSQVESGKRGGSPRVLAAYQQL
jgi:DNA-binding XRE family transcriptional regulator